MFTVSWWTILGAVGALLVVVMYGYSISSQIKVVEPTKCSSCPKTEDQVGI